jgi:hypothetical protein
MILMKDVIFEWCGVLFIDFKGFCVIVNMRDMNGGGERLD